MRQHYFVISWDHFEISLLFTRGIKSIEDITWPRRGTKFLFEYWKTFHERALLSNSFMMNFKLQNAAQRHFVFVECYVVQEAAYSGFSLACLKIRSKNEEAINSTQNETDLLAKCFLFSTLSTSIVFTCFWIDLVLVLATTGNTRKFKDIDSREITSLPDIEKVIYMAHLFNHRRKLFVYSESLQHPTIAILLIQILIFFRALSSVPLLQSNQRFQAIEFVDRHVSEKL